VPCFAAADTSPAPASVTPEQLQQLLKENKDLQEQLRRQQTQIDSLTTKINRMEQGPAGSPERTTRDDGASTSETAMNDRGLVGATLGKVSLSGEGGVALFDSGSQGLFPNWEFRVDEFRLFVEAPIWQQVYFFSEINLATREEPDVLVHLGECYLDFESISELWNRERMLNLRIGRMYAPFGEEYLSRYAIDNPLITHSLSDLWDVDEGIELYGKIGPVRYAAAVQNGGISDVRDFDSDKSIAGRLEYDPTAWLHLSLSGMRTGALNAQQDALSALWFGNAFFRSVGSAATTKFHANLVEGDISIRLAHGRLSAFGGYVRYNDNDPAGPNGRDLYYYSVEFVHNIVSKLYGAARFSQIFANDGFPIAGNSPMGPYFFNPTALTTEIWRLSLGLGYRFSSNLVVKAEYSFERGKELSGATRDHEDLFGLEAAFKF
jgi:hypothetical protein